MLGVQEKQDNSLVEHFGRTYPNPSDTLQALQRQLQPFDLRTSMQTRGQFEKNLEITQNYLSHAPTNHPSGQRTSLQPGF